MKQHIIIPVRITGLSSEKDIDIFYKRIDESFGVTFGLSRLVKYIVEMLNISISNSLNPKYSLLNVKGISLIDNKIKQYQDFTEYAYIYTLAQSDSRITFLDLEDSRLSVICKVYSSPFASNYYDTGAIKSHADDSKSGTIIGNILFEISMYPEYTLSGDLAMYRMFAGGKEFDKPAELIPEVYHEFNHLHKEHVTRYDKKYDDMYDRLILLKSDPKRIVSVVADCLYRYCCWDELNAYTEQAFHEYQDIHDIRQTDTWRLADSDESYFRDVFKTDIPKINTVLYDNFHDICSVVLNMRDIPSKDKEKAFVKSLVKKILKKIQEFKERIMRTTNIPLYETLTYTNAVRVRQYERVPAGQSIYQQVIDKRRK